MELASFPATGIEKSDLAAPRRVSWFIGHFCRNGHTTAIGAYRRSREPSVRRTLQPEWLFSRRYIPNLDSPVIRSRKQTISVRAKSSCHDRCGMASYGEPEFASRDIPNPNRWIAIGPEARKSPTI